MQLPRPCVSASIKMTEIKISQNSLNMYQIYIYIHIHIFILFFSLKLFRNIWFFPRILPDQSREKCSSEVTVLCFMAVWQSRVSGFLLVRCHFPILLSVISLKSWFWNSSHLQQDSVHRCWPFFKLPADIARWCLIISLWLPLLWIRKVCAESDLAQKGPCRSPTASLAVGSHCGAPVNSKPGVSSATFCSQVRVRGLALMTKHSPIFCGTLIES